ncbi:HypC/HybG/HupF family hydrogenase formation chaperone [Methylomagnum sp.]
MCIGLPMRVIEAEEFYALCEGRGQVRRVDTRLVGAQSVGSWLLVFLDAAREVLSPERAREVDDALQALEFAMAGNQFPEHLFADLIDREPQLPEHLRA